MKKKITSYWSAICLLWLSPSLYVQNNTNQKPLLIKEQGAFSAGGTVSKS
ncbi:hypothetical protein [Pedobacter frigiditerrae]|nr:hypothetical protein [Pedobacter frigiditerrae]